MSHEINVTVLIENTSNGTLTCEHGLSLLIQYADKQILRRNVNSFLGSSQYRKTKAENIWQNS